MWKRMGEQPIMKLDAGMENDAPREDRRKEGGGL